MVLGCVSPPISEALPADALQVNIGTSGIIEAQFNAVVLAEIELGKVTL